MSNTVTARFTTSRYATTDTLWQYDYGQILVIEGLELPTAFEVHFCNDKNATTTTQIGTDCEVVIPDEYLETGKNVLAYIYLHTGLDDGETEYKITIPVRNRAKPSDIEPTPVQQDVITEAIAALNSGVEHVEEIAESIESISIEVVDDILTFTTGGST